MKAPAVIFFKQLGDVLLLESALAKLAAAYQQKVRLTTRRAFAPLIELMKDVEMAGFAPTEKASTVISFNATQRAALAAFFIRAESKIAVFKGKSVIRWWHRVAYTGGCFSHPDLPIHRAKYFFDVTPCNAVEPYRPPSLLPPPAAWFPTGIPKNYVLLHGTSAWKRKSWPPSRWAETLNILHDSGVGPFVCTSGGSDWERAFVGELQSATRAPVLNLAGRTDLRAYLALVARARLVLCIDGSVTHIAAAFQRPCVTLFGPTNPVHWHYPTEQSVLISARTFTSEAPYPTSFIPTRSVCDGALELWNRA